MKPPLTTTFLLCHPNKRKNASNSLSLISPPPKRPRPPQPRSNNLPLPCANTSKSVLIVTTHVPILIHIPTLASSCARIGILGRLLQRALTLLPLLLSLPLALHFTLEERFTRPSRVLSLLLRGGATCVFATLLRGRSQFGWNVRLRLRRCRRRV
jgi:hypothetical protein